MHWSSFVVSMLSSVVSVFSLLSLFRRISHCIGSSLGPHSLIPSTLMSHAHCVSLIASKSPLTSSSSSSSLWSPCSSFCPSTSTSLMSWTNTLRTSAEGLGTLAENEPPRCYEPNEYHITEAYVDYTQWLRLRWRHYRQDAPWCVPKTCRSLWRRRPVVLSVVVGQSW